LAAHLESSGLSLQLKAVIVSIGLYLHPMGGFDIDQTRKLLKIPEDYEIVTITAIGRKGDPQKLSSDLKELELAPRERKPLSEIVSKGSF